MKNDEYLWIYLIFIGIPIGILISCCLLSKFYRRKRKETRKPTRFRFVENLNPKNAYTYEYDGNIVVRCEKTRGFWRILRKLIPCPEFGMWVLRDAMMFNYGSNNGRDPRFKIPDDVVSIAIPRNNFRVRGEFWNDFEPKDGIQGEYSYELYSSSIQVTWFHYDNTKYIAGIVIYMDNRYNPFKINKNCIKSALDDCRIYQPNPANFKEKLMKKVWCSFRNEWIIMTRNEFGEVDKYSFNGQENEMERVTCPDCSFYEHNTNECSKKSARPLPTLDFSKFLKVEFCEKWNDLVMIGKDSNGMVAHFNWDSEIGKFKVQSCLDCNLNARGRLEENQDAPPSYEFLEMIELTQEQK